MMVRKEVIGDCTLYLGDCAEILPTLEKVDAVVTDPPYIIEFSGGGFGGLVKAYSKAKALDISDGFDLKLLNYFSEIISFCNKAQIKSYIEYAESRKLKWQLLTWHKENPPPLTNNNYLPCTEYIFHIWDKPLGSASYNDRFKYYISKNNYDHFDHPTCKPLPLIVKLIKNISGEIIVDPFMGSGTTGAACVSLNRKFVGIEKEVKYFDIACKRIEGAYKQPDIFITRPGLQYPVQQAIPDLMIGAHD